MTFDKFKNILETILPETTDKQFDMFAALDPLYREWNAKINVISRKDIDELYCHHILHSLGIAVYLRQHAPELYKQWIDVPKAGTTANVETITKDRTGTKNGTDTLDGNGNDNAGSSFQSVHNQQYKILDLGCGGGFPGIPLAIMFPNVSFTLCDSIGKKITVAKEVAAAAGLTNVTTVNARAESIDTDKNGKFDYIVSRAVTSLDNFMPWVKGKYTDGILYLKGGNLDEEIAAARRGGSLPKDAAVGVWNLDNAITDEWFEEKKLVVIKR